MATEKNEGIRMLEPLVCDAIPGPPGPRPKPEPVSAAEYDAHHQSMLSSDLSERFYWLIQQWRAGQANENTLKALTSIRKVLQGRGKDPGSCEDHGNPTKFGRW
jgi:hypothetical protein